MPMTGNWPRWRTLSEAGKVGFAVGLDEAGQTVTVDFDDLVIKAW